MNQNDFECKSNLFFSTNVKRACQDMQSAFPMDLFQRTYPRLQLGLDTVIQASSIANCHTLAALLVSDTLDFSKGQPQALILAPTIETVLEFQKDLSSMSKYIPGFCADVFIRGNNLLNDHHNLQYCQAVIGTPGRFKVLLEKKSLEPQTICTVILLQSERLFCDGLRQQMSFIFELLPQDKQVVSFCQEYTRALQQFVTSRTRKAAVFTFTLKKEKRRRLSVQENEKCDDRRSLLVQKENIRFDDDIIADGDKDMKAINYSDAEDQEGTKVKETQKSSVVNTSEGQMERTRQVVTYSDDE